LLNTCAVSAGETRPCRTLTDLTWRAVWGWGSIYTIPWRPEAVVEPQRPTAGTAGTARQSSQTDSDTAYWSPCQAYRRKPPLRWCCGRMRFGPERLNAVDRTTAIHTLHLCCCGRDECVTVVIRPIHLYSTGRCTADTCGERKKRNWNARLWRGVIRAKTCRGRVIIIFFFHRTLLNNRHTIHPSEPRRGGGRYNV